MQHSSRPTNFRIIVKLALVFLLANALGACGVAHVRTDNRSADLVHYENVYIVKVTVESHEEAAKTNPELQKRLSEWSVYARSEVERCILQNRYKLLTDPPADASNTLLVSADFDVHYGNRALRYWVGFGAGKGWVDAVLSAVDSTTQQERFRAVANSDLAIGAFGGDMESVLKDNIRKLTTQFPSKSN